jgi:hypothetical protein
MVDLVVDVFPGLTAVAESANPLAVAEQTDAFNTYLLQNERHTPLP